MDVGAGPQDAAEFSPGAMVGRYRVERLLGRGGMGAVYAAFDTALHRPVALKVVSSAAVGSGGSEARERFVREARALAGLAHANVVTVFDVGEHDGAPFMAMELLSGRSLRELAGEVGAWPERVRWLVEVARGLSAAHRAGLVHRDVKPENVLVTTDGAVKVIDFGIAQQTRHDARLDTLTGPQTLIGTVQYMSPEQIRGEPLDGRSDQFAWGAMAYELLAGRPLWSGEPMAVIGQVLSAQPPALGPLCPGVPEPVVAVVERALAKDRVDRFGDMDAVAAALAPYAAGGAAPASPEGLLPTLPSPRASADGLLPTLASRPARGPTAPGRWRLAALVLVLASGAGWAWHARRGVSARPVTLLTLPAPEGCSAEALKRYGDGLRMQHDGSWGQACLAFQAAAKDEYCAAAALRAARVCAGAIDTSQVRRLFQRAARLRDHLSERNRQMLHALEPTLAADPADPAESLRRMQALSAERPNDAELAFEVAAGERLSSDPALMAQAEQSAERVVRLDPEYADALQSLATMRLKRNDVAAGLALLGRCAEVAPSNTDCFAAMAVELSGQGRCQEALEAARKEIGRAPDGADGYELAAAALAGTGAPQSAVADVLNQFLQRRQQPERIQDALFYQATRALLYGPPEQAEPLVQSLREAVDSEPTLEPHVRASLLWVELRLELGDAAGAGRAASESLARSKVWLAPAMPANWLASDVARFEPELLDAERAAGMVNDLRSLPSGDRGAGPTTALPAVRWAYDSALSVHTPEAAQTALKQAAAMGVRFDAPLQPMQLISAADAFAGHTLLLAGRSAEAVEVLGRATRACSALRDPIVATWAQLWLAQALAANGDAVGACKPLAVVEQRWGRSAHSTTLAEARRLESKLACAKP